MAGPALVIQGAVQEKNVITYINYYINNLCQVNLYTFFDLDLNYMVLDTVAVI